MKVKTTVTPRVITLASILASACAISAPAAPSSVHSIAANTQSPTQPNDANANANANAHANADADADAVTAPGLTAEIERLNLAMETAFRDGDMHGLARNYADDAVMLAPGGGRYAGRAEIDAYWAKFTDPVDWQLDVLEVEGEATLAVQRGRSTLVYRRDGVEHTSVVQFVLIWVRVDGQWRISVDAYWK